MELNLSIKHMGIAVLVIISILVYFAIDVIDSILYRLQLCVKRALDFIKPFGVQFRQ